MAIEINTEVNERIKQVRLNQGLSQRAFADMVGVSGASVAKIETGINNPSEQTIRAICDQFYINREWLETGEGEMFRQMEDPELLLEVMKGSNEKKKELIRIIAEMPDELLNAALAVLDYVEERRKRR